VKRHLWIGLVSLAALAGGCASHKAAESGPVFHPVAVNNFARTWSVDLGLHGAKATETFVFDKLIIVYADDHTAHVVDRQSGQLKFINQLPIHSGEVHGPAVVGDLIVYPATSSIRSYSIKLFGRLVREVEYPFALRSAGTGSGNDFYLSADYANGGRLEALDLTSNISLPRWEVMTVAQISGKPILYQNVIYVASRDGEVRAITEERGGLWALDDTRDGGFKAAGKIIGGIAVDESAVYVASTDSNLYALNRATGKIKWRYIAGIPLEDTPVTTTDMAYIYVNGQGLTAISKLEGDYFRKPKWSVRDATKFLADDDKYTYVLLESNQVAAIEKTTGRQKFVSTRTDLSNFGVNPKDGLVYATDPDGNLLQIKPVVKQGVVGELVLDVRPLEIASR
jgi:outer membrane protein assembly factor BamB